jgi:hypothetical protein
MRALPRRPRRAAAAAAAATLIGALGASILRAQAEQTDSAASAGPRLQVYGFAMLDLIYDFRQVDPDWYDMERPSKLPASPNQFGEDRNTWASVRPSRLGVRGWLPTALGELQTELEFDLLGVGGHAGETTFHLRHAWGSLGPILAGQTWSVFMDPGVFPTSIEFWGPNGMVFYRNVQLRWTPLDGDRRLAFALERPGATGDSGEFAGRIELQHVQGRFPYPDFTAQYHHGASWGYVQVAGLVRYIGWIDTLPDAFDLGGHTVGWGVNVSSNLKLGPTGTLRMETTYGRGIETYMRDAPADVAAQRDSGDPRRPVVGRSLPVFGMVAFYDFRWSDRFSTAVGYSRLDITNSDGQAPDAFRGGEYALADVLFYPVKNAMTGLELQWGRRRNFSDGFAVNDFRVQFSARYSFSIDVGMARR